MKSFLEDYPPLYIYIYKRGYRRYLKLSPLRSPRRPPLGGGPRGDRRFDFLLCPRFSTKNAEISKKIEDLRGLCSRSGQDEELLLAGLSAHSVILSVN